MATINVPFIDEENVVRVYDHADKRKKNIEDLIREEFGSLDAVYPDLNRRTGNEQSAVTAKSEAKTRAEPARRVISARFNPARSTLHIDIYGPLSKQVRAELPSLLQMIEQHRPRTFEIDMARCPDIRSSGLGLLLLLKEATGTERVHVINCSAQVQQLLSWAGIEIKAWG